MSDFLQHIDAEKVMNGECSPEDIAENFYEQNPECPNCKENWEDCNCS